MTKILVVDRQRGVRNSLKEFLEHEGYTVVASETLPDMNDAEICAGLSLVICGQPELIEPGNIEYPWIALPDSRTYESVVGILRAGAIDLVAKPIDVGTLLSVVRNALRMSEENSAPVNHRGARKKSCQKCRIVGDSPRTEKLRNAIGKVAPTEARVLIMGENGTGKELVAHQIHLQSNRANGPLVEVNCAAIPSELIESELFGHEKGAFTSAVRQRKGKFEQAIGGTLFLDEIGDMSIAAQAKVLRALQERKITRVGSDKDIDVDVRVVAATNKNLVAEIARGNFREDLFHRLSVIVIEVPPLSERREDIPQLVDYFLREVCDEYHIPLKTIEPSALKELEGMEWKGNVRQVHNVVERLVVLAGNPITRDEVLDNVSNFY